MGAVTAKGYRSPSLILLAFDWADGATRQDFLGFAVRRSPGFRDHATGAVSPTDWLPNRLSFNGPPAAGQPDFPSNIAPIQKFMWWDARLEGVAAGATLTYEMFAVCGTAAAPSLVNDSRATLQITLPPHVEFGVGTWFNRAVMSSQAFSRKVAALNLAPGTAPTAAQALDLRSWLANGMEQPIPAFIAAAQDSIAGAIYHLNDMLWIVPALHAAMAHVDIGLIYDANVKKKDGVALPNESQVAIDDLASVKFLPRDKINIMHNKFLVGGTKVLNKTGHSAEVLACGSANYTTGGLTSQANLVHTFASPPLAELYRERWQLLKDDPAKKNIVGKAAWSNTVSVGDAGIRVFFSPEKGKPGDHSASMETVVQAVHAASSSVIFCLFTPTDAALRDACFSVGDAGKMMFGLVNHVAHSEPTATPNAAGNVPADELAALEIYHRSRNAKDTIGAEFFSSNNVPAGFEREVNVFPGEHAPSYPPVLIHHKFIVVDAETESPTIFSGSANMSGNSVFGNDENLLEIKGSPRLAHIYLTEFLRLYEHYRARARFIAWKQSGQAPANAGFALAGDRTWANKHFTVGTPEYKARLRMLSLT
jgi:phosphatidylserine/phosphatidylglycerophosphate/cardiolipin synthase-like enzyme